VVKLVRRAQRRFFFNELFAQGANLASAVLLAVILLLLAGTEVLNWQWLVLLPLGAAAIGLYTAWRRRPSAYRTAQLVDTRLGLADTLSTALYFRYNPPQVSSEVVRLQAEAAERVSENVDPRAAVPFRMPRTAYAMAALLLVAGSLFALRYAVSRSLDLKPPLARILEQNFGSPKTENTRQTPPKMRPADAQAQEDVLASADNPEQKGDSQDGQPDLKADNRDSQQAKAESKDGAKGAQAQEQEGQSADSQNGDDDRAGNSADSESGQTGNSKDAKQGNSKQDANNSGENSSLISKVKDAMQNLLSKMKPQQNQPGAQQQSGEQRSQQGKGQQNGSKQQNARNGQQQGQQQADAQDGQSGDQSQNSQDAQGKGTGNSDAKQASKQPGSGIGSQDGDKSIKQAEQLAAMGKISEIIGKRAQNISGETTVEVQSTSQVLKTPYANRGAQHTQNGAEISRDEIPVALQSYVEQYFEQVRKQARK